MTHEALFYVGSYAIGFLLCFPFGAASLEMLRLSLAGERRAALQVAAGAGLACGGWALLSFLGVRSVMRFMEVRRVRIFLLAAAAALLGWIAVAAWRDARRLRSGVEPTRTPSASLGPAAQLGKGVLLGLLNPQTIASWAIALSLLRQAGFPVPSSASAWLPFFLAVTAGYGTFYIAVIQLARRLRSLRSAGFLALLQQVVAVLLAAMALLCACAFLRLAGS